MSFHAERWAWAQPLPTSEKIVLLKLAHHVDRETHETHPGVRAIALACGLSERQVQRYLKSFVARGILAIEDNEGGGRGKTRVYKFTYLDLVKGDTDDTHSEPEKGDIDAPERVTPMTERVTPDDTVSNMERVTPDAQKGDISDEKGDTFARANPEPSDKNRQGEPSSSKPMPRHGAAQTLVATLYEDVLQIGPPTNYRQAVGQAESLVKAGCSADELRQIATWLLADPFWSGKGITMTTIVKQRDNWRGAQQRQQGSGLRFVSGGYRRNGKDIGLSDDELEAIARGIA